MLRNLMKCAGVFALVAVVGLGVPKAPAVAADHVDLPQNAAGDTVERPDASITDFWAFVARNKLVMIIGLNPFLSPDVEEYQFPTDVTYTFNIDNDSEIAIGSDVVSSEFGGVFADPAGISADLTYAVTFDSQGNPKVTSSNQGFRLFTGLRAEGFIFAPFVRNNIGAIVIEVPLSQVRQRRQGTLALWATASVDVPAGPFTELGARALRSQFDPFLDLNALHPSKHLPAFPPAPDVVIIDTTRPTEFPNGRALRDDVVDIAAGFTSLETDAAAAGLEFDLCAPGGPFEPCPVAPSATANDVRILSRFPWLGPPF